jgi:hypothetical protein
MKKKKEKKKKENRNHESFVQLVGQGRLSGASRFAFVLAPAICSVVIEPLLCDRRLSLLFLSSWALEPDYDILRLPVHARSRTVLGHGHSFISRK